MHIISKLLNYFFVFFKQMQTIKFTNFKIVQATFYSILMVFPDK